MRISNLFAICIVAFSIASCSAELRVKNRGGCMVLYLRDTGTNSPVESQCDAIPVVHYGNGQSFQQVYSWIPPFVAVSFDQAERAACGVLGCATDKTQVTLFLLANGIPNASVDEGKGYITLTLNTGLIDFIDAASRSYLVDIEDAIARKPLTRGYQNWMTSMRSLGNTCQPHVPFPTPSVSQADFMTAQEISHATYQFVFGHELAHYRSEVFGACGHKPPGLAREMACDRISTNSLLEMKDSSMFPGAVAAVLMALDTYSRVAGPSEFGIMERGTDATNAQEFIKSMPWNARASQIVDLWDRFCRAGANSKVCPANFDDVIIPARELTDTPPPASCTP